MESYGRTVRACSFQEKYDIVGLLPLEILLQIVDYLDPADIILCQMVSRKWRPIFSSDAIIKFVLRRTLAFLDMDVADISVNNATTYFRWRHGLQFVRPAKKMFLPWPDAPRAPMKIAYHSRRLCLETDSEIEILDLEAARRSRWIKDEAVQNEFPDILLSDCYVVINAGNSYLIALNIRTSGQYARELPFVTHETYIVNDKVVIVGFESKPIYPVYIWDVSSDHFRMINDFADLGLWHVDTTDNTLVAFEIDWDTYPAAVQRTKWTLTGQLLERKHFRLSLSDRRMDRKILQPSKSFIDLRPGIRRTYGRRTVRTLPYRDPYYCYCTIHLAYDYAVDKLSAEWYDSPAPVFARPNYPFSVALTSRIAYIWNGFSFMVLDHDKSRRLMRPYQLDARELSVRNGLLHQPHRRHQPIDDEPYLWLFGDHEVFGIASQDGVQFWFFNPDFSTSLPDAEPFLAMEESG